MCVRHHLWMDIYPHALQLHTVFRPLGHLDKRISAPYFTINQPLLRSAECKYNWDLVGFEPTLAISLRIDSQVKNLVLSLESKQIPSPTLAKGVGGI